MKEKPKAKKVMPKKMQKEKNEMGLKTSKAPKTGSKMKKGYSEQEEMNSSKGKK